MSPSTMFSATLVLLLVLASFNGQVRKAQAQSGTTVLVTSFPHFQTFDSWDTCAFDGPCYGQSCPDLRGGWVNEEWHSNANATNAVRHWWVNRGPTTSNRFVNGTNYPCAQVRTGPCNDHTFNNESGAYLYAEGSACQRTFFYAKTPPFRFTNTNAVLSFWYYMHGSTIDNTGEEGALRVNMSINGGDFVIELFDETGTQVQDSPLDPWAQFNVTLDPYFPAPANASNPVTAQFRFIAQAAGNADEDDWRNDIAIDDILVTQAGASSELDPYEDPPPSNSTTGSGVITEDGDGITDGQIAGIVVGVVGGLLLCCLLMIILVIILLLIISPKKPQGLPGNSGPDDL